MLSLESTDPLALLERASNEDRFASRAFALQLALITPSPLPVGRQPKENCLPDWKKAWLINGP